jgi:hypothetical protein
VSDTAKAELNQQASANDCPCGHPLGGYYICLNGRIYGPCSDENCGGTCDDTHGRCTSDNCACEEAA